MFSIVNRQVNANQDDSEGQACWDRLITPDTRRLKAGRLKIQDQAEQFSKTLSQN